MADPLTTLQEAVRAYGRLANPGAMATEIRIRFHDGSKASLPVPVMAATPVQAEVRAPAPPEPGWSFSETRAFFDGKPLDIYGQKLKLLRVLADTNESLTSDQIRSLAWADYKCEEQTVRWTVGELRKSLRAYFPDMEDPIPNVTGGGYLLAIR